LWVVIGGADKGGIIVRLNAPDGEKAEERLPYGAVLEEIEVAGDRLHYRLHVGTGPGEGWIAIRLSDGKRLVAPLYPEDFSPTAGAKPVGDVDEVVPNMTFYAISDVHVELPQNMGWLESLPRYTKSTVIVAGDLGVKLSQVEAALKLFKAKFDHVFYCFGNHETWVHKAADDSGCKDSAEKLLRLQTVCEELGVHTTPQLIEGVWVVPILGWYHTTWDTEPPLQAPPGQKLLSEPKPGVSIATDSSLCKWDHPNGSEMLSRQLDLQNEEWGIWPLPLDLRNNLRLPRGERKSPVITYSHFLPRLELMPEKRFLFQPGLMQIVGSTFIYERMRQISPDLHIFGHSHFPWDATLDDGVRYRSWPLGTPQEQARRIATIGYESTEKWMPYPVFDSLGRHYSGDVACWFSLMYTRIPREPLSYRMAGFVKDAFCPDAPAVAGTIINPIGMLEPETDEIRERRIRYAEECMKSVHKEVRMARGTR